MRSSNNRPKFERGRCYRHSTVDPVCREAVGRRRGGSTPDSSTSDETRERATSPPTATVASVEYTLIYDRTVCGRTQEEALAERLRIVGVLADQMGCTTPEALAALQHFESDTSTAGQTIH